MEDSQYTDLSIAINRNLKQPTNNQPSNQYTELKNSLSSASAKALNFSSRLILANNLDYKQALQSRNGIARDYRGLADLMGIPYQITLKFANSENPTIKILETWETSPDATLDKLITFLEEMERHDVISEIIPFLEKNVHSYLQYQRSLESPIQVSEEKNVDSYLQDQRSLESPIQVSEEKNVDSYLQYQRSLESPFQVAEAKYLNLTLDGKRKEYLCQSKYITQNIIYIKPWSEHDKTVTPYHCPPVCSKNPMLNEKVSIFVGNIIDLEIDAIVNAALNKALRGGGGVDGAIHRAAGPKLLEECITLHGCNTGDAKITGGYRLPPKSKYLNLTLDEKRKEYLCKSKYITLNDIKPWSEHGKAVTSYHCLPVCSKNPMLNEKVSIFVGDITALEIDAIVTSANHALRDGGLVNGEIHRAAGPKLLEECKTLHGYCKTGDAKITGGYRLPAKYVIHTVGPIEEKKEALASCYKTSLKVALKNNLKTVAFPCISTGAIGYPNDKAAPVAIRTVRKMLEKNKSSFDRIIFCLFLPVHVAIYESLMHEYFPI